MSAPKVKVLFVCLGNICRSPTAHAVFQKMVDDADLSDQILVDSAGTGDWHIGHPPDARAQRKALTRGYDLSPLRARLVTGEDFAEFHYIIGMDDSNMTNMLPFKPANYDGEFKLFLSYGESSDYREVPDPYYSGDDGFELVLDLVEQAAAGLLADICKRYSLPDSSVSS
ncbi:low molecular weight protein-tyrosine-phosphatase [Porticoccus sp. W117]|uniref:low molecular weight protein-tyrosine-phosphatase n=1 Tax=Porticoccus sp. W117 TaxID=3054777 RepID=UPI00259597CC|nr:low molecular weight protein-tyrosine-phosphatase [Porticoccus sp. W117]MDM3872127.1 low molecular weight protein-tyrosine-phosphatase [Porticoccus sp. W117]